MVGLLKKTLQNSLALFLLTQCIAGFKIIGGVETFILAGFALAIVSFIAKPILTILTLPLNMATFGIFSFLTNAVILYIVTIFIPQIVIKTFIFPGTSIAGFVVPKIEVSELFAYIVAAFVLSLITWFITWISK